ncbi:MAG: SDR family oxidoreductase [Actinobacteria bacterium]|nr:SDR family oxidoreductase [Actinomycetota bacterium]
MGLLVGKTAVVTGASSGIGAALVRAFLVEGASVVGAARGAEGLARACLLPGLPPALPVPTDVGDEGAVARLFATAVATYGRVDIVVNSAGTLVRGPIEELALADWEAALHINLTGVFLCSREAVRVMLRQAPASGGVRGHIVQIVSGSGVHAWVGAGAYTAAKHGVMGFSDTLREEVRHRGIKVTDVLPGMVETSMTDHPDFAEREKLAPEDVVHAVMAALTASPRALMKRVDLRNLEV